MPWIKYWSTDIKQSYYGSTAIKEVYYWSKKIRPALIFDISKASLFKSYSLWYAFQATYINPNQNRVITCNYSSWNLKSYTFSNKDISTASLTWTKTWTTNAHCVYANSTWTHIYYGNHSWNTVTELSTTNWEVSSATAYKSKNLWHIIQAFWISPNEDYMVVCNPTSNSTAANSTLWLYKMTTKWDLSTATLVKTVSNVFAYNCHGIWFDEDMKKCVACAYNSSSWTVYQYERDVLNSNTPTLSHTLSSVWFTIWYASITDDGTYMYASRENWYIYQYKLK